MEQWFEGKLYGLMGTCADGKRHRRSMGDVGGEEMICKARRK